MSAPEPPWAEAGPGIWTAPVGTDMPADHHAHRGSTVGRDHIHPPVVDPPKHRRRWTQPARLVVFAASMLAGALVVTVGWVLGSVVHAW